MTKPTSKPIVVVDGDSHTGTANHSTGPEVVGLKSIILYRGADGQYRPAIVTRLNKDGINAVVFGSSHDDSEAGLKCDLTRNGDHWIAGA